MAPKNPPLPNSIARAWYAPDRPTSEQQLPNNVARAWYGPVQPANESKREEAGSRAQNTAKPPPLDAAERYVEELRYERYKQLFAGVSTIDSGKATTNSTCKQPRPASRDKKRRSVIFGAIQGRLKGPKYCSKLDERQIRLPVQWTQDGCPDTYAKAYKEEKWRKRIQDEKCRYRKQYDATSAPELEAIIQEERKRPTRRTRE